MAYKKTHLLIFALIFTLNSCSIKMHTENSLQKQYGDDSHYFIGLKALEKKDTKSALRHFSKSQTNGTKYVKRRSIEQKIKLGNVTQQIEQAKNYLTIYNDDAALIFACQIFYDNNEFNLIINSTNSIDLSTCSNLLAQMRLIALHHNKDVRLFAEIAKWYTSRKINSEHIDFYNDYLQNDLENIDLELIEPVESDIYNLMKLNDYNSKIYKGVLSKVISFRILCNTRNYSKAYDELDFINEYCIKQKIIPLTKYLVSDIGKIYYTVSKQYSKNAKFFLDLANSEYSIDKDIKYYAVLYAARIYEKSGVYITLTDTNYTLAMQLAPTKEDYDMALWFLLNSKLVVSTEEAIATLKEFCSTWNDPYYFADFLDNLSLLLFTSAKWNSFREIYTIIDGYADNATTSKFAYLTARLIKLNYLKVNEKNKESEINNALQKAFSLNAGLDVYYRLLAAKELNLPLEKIEKEIFNSTTAILPKNDYDAQILLRGYADFGFPELIYPEWQYFYKQNPNTFDIETVCYISEFVNSYAKGVSKDYYNSLHIITKSANLDNSKLNKKIFSLSYPKNFAKEISKACKEFNTEEYDMLGLIRTESFFNPVVESHKGAMGLSQLMLPTFEECVRKLKIENADITDPYTNIRIGTYYYSNLVKRLNNCDILALFAYNAGATKVRRWLETSRVGLGLYKNLPSDLFLETIPIYETRNYGRKVIQSAAVYAYLYYDKNPCDIIAEMM